MRGGRGNFRESNDRGRGRGFRERETTGNFRPDEDLSDVISLNKIDRSSFTLWDKVPKGYEKVSVERAKLSGLFPLPGASTGTIDMNKVDNMVSQGEGKLLQDILRDNCKLETSNSKNARRCIVLGDFTNVESVVKYIEEFVASTKLDFTPAMPIIQKHVLSEDKKRLVLEVSDFRIATIIVAMDSKFIDSLNMKIRVTRPGEYIIPHEEETAAEEVGKEEQADHVKLEKENNNLSKVEISSKVLDGPNKIAVTNIEQSREELLKVLQEFGTLKGFELLCDESGTSKGIAFCEYVDSSTLNVAVRGLSKQHRVHCFKVCDGMKQPIEIGYNSLPEAASGSGVSTHPESRVLQFLNCITINSDLVDNSTYNLIKSDFVDECKKVGQVIDCFIPRPPADYKPYMIDELSAEVGRIYVKFGSVEAATKAMKSLAGRTFSERTVLVTYFSERDYDAKIF